MARPALLTRLAEERASEPLDEAGSIAGRSSDGSDSEESTGARSRPKRGRANDGNNGSRRRPRAASTVHDKPKRSKSTGASRKTSSSTKASAAKRRPAARATAARSKGKGVAKDIPIDGGDDVEAEEDEGETRCICVRVTTICVNDAHRD